MGKCVKPTNQIFEGETQTYGINNVQGEEIKRNKFYYYNTYSARLLLQDICCKMSWNFKLIANMLVKTRWNTFDSTDLP